ncbi:uncharacterized protein LOC125479357 [Pyrus x bretschneideri]|uniref:uncharacterized protein LOC125479357 n=1 Tax=Pyrus x bretschneideri TaxID=225117 RepID=UPI00202EAF67|nr:uncharacterized protein LOC125479357 [Pyrus x bretschneideri]
MRTIRCLDLCGVASQVNDDGIILDTTVANQVSMWKSSRGIRWKLIMLVLVKSALTSKLETYLFVRRLARFMYVMIIAEKLLWIRPMSFGSAQYLGTVSMGFYHRKKWSQMLSSSKEL